MNDLISEIEYLSSLIADENPYSDLQERCSMVRDIAIDIENKIRKSSLNLDEIK